MSLLSHCCGNRAARWPALLAAALLTACASTVPVSQGASPAADAGAQAAQAARPMAAAAVPFVPSHPTVVPVTAPTAGEPLAAVPAVPPASTASGEPVSSPAVSDEPAGLSPPALTGEPPAPLARGMASWYGPRFHGRRTASGERYDMHELTAAHKTLPFGTRLRVRSVHTGKEVVVRVNDRGPYKHQRIIDLSRAAMVALGTLERGVTEVEILRE